MINSIKDLKETSKGTKVIHHEKGECHVEVTQETRGIHIWHGCDNITFNMLTKPASEGGDLNRCQLTDLVEVALHQLKYLNGKFPCRENAITITKLEEALMWQQKRTIDRVMRKVEGENKI